MKARKPLSCLAIHNIFATTQWSLWNARNDRLWNNHKLVCKQLVLRAKQVVDEWMTTKNMNSNSHDMHFCLLMVFGLPELMII